MEQSFCLPLEDTPCSMSLVGSAVPVLQPCELQQTKPLGLWMDFQKQIIAVEWVGSQNQSPDLQQMKAPVNVIHLMGNS